MQRFTDLRVWQRSHALVKAIYRLTEDFPAHERFGITSQLRRAASAVPTNIAEGAKRQRRFDFARFLNIAEGSIAETEYLLLLASELGYTEDTGTMRRECEELSRMLCALREQVQTREREERKAKRAGP